MIYEDKKIYFKYIYKKQKKIFYLTKYQKPFLIYLKTKS